MEWAFDQTPAMRYRQHGKNDTGARTSTSGVRKRLALIKSGWYLQQLKVIAEISLAAEPDNVPVTNWIGLMDRSRGIARTWKMVAFCIRGGRRRRSDKMLLVGAVIAGWI
jgi:hypothetical protein